MPKSPKKAAVDSDLTIKIKIDGIEKIFECHDDLLEAFKETKRILLKYPQKSKESKRRGSRFLLDVLNSGFGKDPGGRIRRFCEFILSDNKK